MDQPRVNFAQSCVSCNTLNVALYLCDLCAYNLCLGFDVTCGDYGVTVVTDFARKLTFVSS